MENTLDGIRKDLEYAINRNWLGSPDDCVPKSIIRQIIDAEAPDVEKEIED